MAVGFKRGNIIDEIGTPEYLHAFFLTISHRLEGKNAGSRFPVLLKRLYNGKLNWGFATRGLEELAVISNELRQLSPEEVVWDKQAERPYELEINNNATDLACIFITLSGRNVLEILRECLEEQRDRGGSLEIVDTQS